MLNKTIKEAIIKKFAIHKNDTGSVETQIAVLTKEIEELTKHLEKNKHDFSSKYGLFKKIGHRRKLLKYLKKEKPANFEKIKADLKI
ncbi:MAG: 30S ribosomal protein S15 [Patescibacteria group bacterium]